MDVFGIRLVGINAESGQKVLYTLALLALIYLLGRGANALVRSLLVTRANEQTRFWTRQAISVATLLLSIIGFLSIWFDDPTRLATALGLVTAGLAFALQRVVTALAGYLVILRGNNFTVGDRIAMGGVRGDVIGLGPIQTTIMEMGQPPAVQGADPPMWVRSRQYTGRVVTESNDKIFDEPVYNFTRDFPYIWEEIALPIPYTADRERAEQILLSAATHFTADIQQDGREAMKEMTRRFAVQAMSVEPRVFYRLTDNWLELSLRFLTEAHGVRDIKDAMSRRILSDLDAAGNSVASATFELVGTPPIELMNRTVPRATKPTGTNSSP
jgi:small-conductance mechanosensitive channel